MSQSEEQLSKIDEAEEVEKEQLDSEEELEQEKRSLHEFNAKENIADTQWFIQNLDKVFNINCYMKQEGTVSQERLNERTYDLENKKDCVEFIEEHMGDEYLLVALILCTFEFVTLGDLPNLRAELGTYLPQKEVMESKEEKHFFYQNNPYLSLDSIFDVIGAKQFIVEEGQQCVGFGKESTQVLANVWEQFPALRQAIILWLIHLNDTYEMSTALRTYQIFMAFERFISLDIVDAKMKIFPRLYENEKNIGLLGFLAYKLYCNSNLKQDVMNIMEQWIKTDLKWIWKCVCLTYCYFGEREEDFPYEKQLKRKLVRKLSCLDNIEHNFIANLLQNSKRFRSFVIDILCEMNDMRESKVDGAQLYLKLLRKCYFYVNSKHTELALVCCDTVWQQNQLTSIVSEIMCNYYLRNQLYAILKVYLKELSDYRVSKKTIKHIAAYFYNMSLAGKEYQLDIIDWLEECDNKVSRQILDFI